MKVKLKFDMNSIKEFFIRHVEKFVFGAAILALVYLVWSSTGIEQIDLTPERLTQTAAAAQEKIDRLEPKPTREVNLYSNVAKKIRQDILAEQYKWKTIPDNPPIPPPHLRPPLPAVTVEGLHVSAGHGAMLSAAIRPDALAQNRGTEGVRWVVITGLIPLQKQINEATDAYRETLPAFDPARDIPEINWFYVERAEVGARADLDHLDWKKVPVPVRVGDPDPYRDKWRGSSREVVPEKYVYPSRNLVLASLIPPMGEDYVWGDELVHMPEIPRQVRDDNRPGAPGFLRRSGNQPGAVAPPPPGADAAPPQGNPPEGPEAPPDANGNGEPATPVTANPGSPAMAGRQPGRPGGGPNKSPAMPGGGLDREQPAEVRLFRCFDFTVEPGKRYRYRVRLCWTNPNYNIPGQFLANPVDAKDFYIKAEWSAPSEMVGVPRDARILAGKMTKPEQCEVGIVYFDIATGSEAFEMLDVARGQWLNFYGRTLHTVQSGRVRPMPVGPVAPVAQPHRERTGGGHYTGGHGAGNVHPPVAPHPIPHPHPGAGAIPATEEAKVDYITDSLLLDVSGGAKIPGPHGHDTGLKEPGHVLLLDPQGNLVVLNELADEEEIKSLTPRVDKVVAGPIHGPKPPRNKKDAGNDLNTLMAPPPSPPPKKAGNAGK